MIDHLSLPVALMLSTGALANGAASDPLHTSEVDAIECRLDASEQFVVRGHIFSAV